MRRLLPLCVLGSSPGCWWPCPPPAPRRPRRRAPRTGRSAFARWEGGPAFRTGSRSGTPPQARRAGPQGHRASSARYRGTPVRRGHLDLAARRARASALTQLVASWSAGTPRNSWVEVRVRLAGGDRPVRWMVLGRWASSDKHVRRTSVPGQSDALGRVDVDTWKASGAGASSYQLQVRLMRRSGASSASPSVSMLGAVASRLPVVGAGRLRPRRGARGRARRAALLADGAPRRLPAVRRRRRGLVLADLDRDGARLLRPAARRLVATRGSARARTRGSTRSRGGRTTRRTRGTGNWPFNTAYAASRGLSAFVTRLRSLTRGRVARRGRHPGDRLGVLLVAAALYRRPHLRPPPATCW